MGLLARIKEFINPPKECQACVIYQRLYDDIIAGLKEEIRHLRYQEEDSRESVKKLVRITPNVTSEVRKAAEPVNTRSTSWASAKKKLEEQHKKKPEDQVAAYWQEKAAKLETEATEMLKGKGLNAGQQNRPEVEVDDLQQDLETLKDVV